MPKGARVQLEFYNFSLQYDEYSYHYLKVYDGRDSSAPVGVTMIKNKYENFLATGNEVFIEFRTTQYTALDKKAYGFKLRYYDNPGKIKFKSMIRDIEDHSCKDFKRQLKAGSSNSWKLT